MKNPDEYKIINGKPQITPDMISAPNGTERIVVSVAIDLMRKLKEKINGFKMVSGLKIPVEHYEAEQPLTEFKMEWERWPIPESYVDKACSDMSKAIKHNLKKNGLMK